MEYNFPTSRSDSTVLYATLRHKLNADPNPREIFAAKVAATNLFECRSNSVFAVKTSQMALPMTDSSGIMPYGTARAMSYAGVHRTAVPSQHSCSTVLWCCSAASTALLEWTVAIPVEPRDDPRRPTWGSTDTKAPHVGPSFLSCPYVTREREWVPLPSQRPSQRPSQQERLYLITGTKFILSDRHVP